MSVSLIEWFRSPKPLKSLYTVIGTEAFFVSQIKKTFINSIPKEALDFSHDEVFASAHLAQDLLTRLETLPFLSQRRLIFCYQAENFLDKDWQTLQGFFNSSSQTATLVCFFAKKDGRKKHFKVLKTKGVELLAQPLREWELDPWLNFISKKQGLNLPKAPLALFKQLVGTNLMEIELELKKLKLYKGEDKSITEKDILACISRVKTDSIFDLTEAIGKKDVVQALSSLAHLLEQNQNEIGALAMLARHIRILSHLREGKKQNLNKNQLAQKAGVSPYFLKNYQNQAELWSEKQIHQTMASLFETDKALKSSPLSSHIWLENFILKACS